MTNRCHYSIKTEREALREVVSTAIYRMVGRGRPWSIRRVHEITGIPRPTLERYRSGACLPGGYNEHLLRKVLGQEYINAGLSVAGYGGAFLISENGCPHKVNLWAARYCAAHAEAANDNHLSQIAGELVGPAAAMAGNRW